MNNVDSGLDAEMYAVWSGGEDGQQGEFLG